MQFVSICMLWQGVPLYFVGVYASSFYDRRLFLWNDLTNLQGSKCILGDFNVVLFVKESKEDNPHNLVSTNEFGSWVNSNNLLTLPHSGSFYTFTNDRLGAHRVDRKLDKIFFNFDCLDLCKACNYSIFPQSNLIIILFYLFVIVRPLFFRFFRCGYNMMICYLIMV